MKMSPGWWLIICTTVYLIAEVIAILVYHCSVEVEFWIQLTWIIVMSLPLFVKPMARWINMKTLW